MNIGQVSQVSGVPAKMIRYYESINLIPNAARSTGGYREFGQDDLHRLAFIKRARELGFSVERIRSLLALWNNKARENSDVKALALEHIQELENRIHDLQQMANCLRALSKQCNEDVYCPIINSLEFKEKN